MTRGGGDSLTFTNPGEQKIDAWIAEHARVAWVTKPEPGVLEERLIATLSLLLNVMGNLVLTLQTGPVGAQVFRAL